MFDIGLGELLALAVVGLLVFGPDRLPKAAADAGRWVRQLKQMAANAKQDLADSAGVDLTDTLDTVKSLGDLHPRKIATNMFQDDEPTAGSKRPSSEAPVIDPDAT
jgi:sec-independent protein translocase protein TatB